AAMSRAEDGTQQRDLLYDHFSEKDDFWFDFMADTGDGGNSSYAVARLLARPSIRTLKDDSEVTLPRGDLLLIGGDLAYVAYSLWLLERLLIDHYMLIESFFLVIS
ncbi:calcineurin-like metallo-phosphoesterase superfamily protein, partial [Trifolium medium]|nr:calcineurin-like metallo-phosphoesterase superfamily protein [Trifolium medium]